MVVTNLAGPQVTIEHRVTNIYQRGAGAWKVVHHHTDICQTMLDVLTQIPDKLQAEGLIASMVADTT